MLETKMNVDLSTKTSSKGNVMLFPPTAPLQCTFKKNEWRLFNWQKKFISLLSDLKEANVSWAELYSFGELSKKDFSVEPAKI